MRGEAAEVECRGCGKLHQVEDGGGPWRPIHVCDSEGCLRDFAEEMRAEPTMVLPPGAEIEFIEPSEPS